MQSKKYEDETQQLFDKCCDGTVIFTAMNKSICYTAINDCNFAEPYFVIRINRLDDDYDNYLISMLEPKYIIEPDLKLTQEEKQILFTEITEYKMWNKIIETMTFGCKECEYCSNLSEPKYTCEYYHNRKFPDNPPDYRLL